jgi:hypothetical protein
VRIGGTRQADLHRRLPHVPPVRPGCRAMREEDAKLSGVTDDGLRRSIKDFREACQGRSKTGERAAYVAAIRAISNALWVRIDREEGDGKADQDDSFLWFEELATQLEDLDVGIVSAVLDCPARRKGLSSKVWMDRSHAVALVLRLHHQRGMKYEAAAAHVASSWNAGPLWTVLNDVSKGDILSWLGEFRKGNVKDRAAVENYEFWEYYIRTGKFRE